MIRLFLYAVILIGGTLYLLSVDSPAPDAQQEAQDVAAEQRAAARDAKRAARQARAEYAIEAEIKRRGCLK